MKKLLIYYGYPSCINRSYSVEKSLEVYSKYDIVVFPGSKRSYKSIEDQSHPDHVNSMQIIKALNNETFGYIACGNRKNGYDSCWNIKEIEKLVESWEQMGVKGIFLDELGYDYGNTRNRINEIVNLIHSKNLNVFANAWDPADVFDSDEEVAAYTEKDYYLLESFVNFCIDEVTEYQKAELIFDKTFRTVKYRKECGVSIAGIDTFGKDLDVLEDNIETALKIANFLSIDAYGACKKNYHSIDPDTIDYEVFDLNFPKEFKLSRFLKKYSRNDMKDKYIIWEDTKFGGKPGDIKV